MQHLKAFARSKQLRWCHAYDPVSKRIGCLVRKPEAQTKATKTTTKAPATPTSKSAYKRRPRIVLEMHAPSTYVEQRSRESWVEA